MWRTKQFTPVFNTLGFINKMDNNGGIDPSFHNRILETILFPKRPISLIKIVRDIAIISVTDYESEKQLYVQSSFLEKGEGEDKLPMPSKELIIERLMNFPKIPYLLGGTIPFPTYLKMPCDYRPFENRNKKLFGIDCSGILYYVTEGNTPRNTRDLMKIGTEVSSLMPLDLILFPGHVIIYLGDGLCIEARQYDGVIKTLWKDRKAIIEEPYKFIRWHPQSF